MESEMAVLIIKDPPQPSKQAVLIQLIEDGQWGIFLRHGVPWGKLWFWEASFLVTTSLIWEGPFSPSYRSLGKSSFCVLNIKCLGKCFLKFWFSEVCLFHLNLETLIKGGIVHPLEQGCSNLHLVFGPHLAPHLSILLVCHTMSFPFREQRQSGQSCHLPGILEDRMIGCSVRQNCWGCSYPLNKEDITLWPS